MIKIMTTKLITSVTIGVIAISALTYVAINANTQDDSTTIVNPSNIANNQVAEEKQPTANKTESKQEIQPAVAVAELTEVAQSVSTEVVAVVSQASQPNADGDKTSVGQANKPVLSTIGTSASKQVNLSVEVTNASIKVSQPKAAEISDQVSSSTLPSIVTQPITSTSAAIIENQTVDNDYTTTEVYQPKTVSFATAAVVQKQTTSTVSTIAVQQTTTSETAPAQQQAIAPVSQQQSSGSVALTTVSAPAPVPAAVSTPAPESAVVSAPIPVAESAPADSSDEEVCEVGCN
jgi:hypothetical protein